MTSTLYAQEKWPKDYSQLCPNCNVIIKLGCGRPANMAQHVGKKQCLRDARCWKQEIMRKQQSGFLASFCKPKDPILSVVIPPSP